MDKKEIQEKLKGTLQGAAGSIKDAAQNVKIPDFKKPDVKVPDIKIPEQVKGIFKKKDNAGNSADSTAAASEELNENTSASTDETPEKTADTSEAQKTIQEKKEDDNSIKAISTENAIKIFYYLMAVDGEVFHSEEEKFDEIGLQMDPNFAEHKEQIVSVCKAQLDKVIDSDDYYDVVQDGVEEAILIPNPSADSFITPKLLVWDLLTIAYSDEQYNEKERRLLKYIVRKFNIDSTIFIEMESSLQTLMDIEKETNWIKTTNRPYLTIEAQVNELADRRNVIFESVKDLIML